MLEPVQASLTVANQVILKDLRGEDNFDNVLSSLKEGQKDVTLVAFVSPIFYP